MATITEKITENLQTIYDSRIAIKQAIIDKGGSVGDLTTYAAAITNLPSGGGNNKKITFTGTISSNKISGTLTGVPDLGYFIIIYMSDRLNMVFKNISQDGNFTMQITDVMSPSGNSIVKLLFCPVSVFEQMPLYASDEVYDVEFIQE